MRIKRWFESNYIDFSMIGLFLILSFLYFSAVLEGKVLYQSDVLEAKAMSKEIMDFKEATGKAPLWTNAMYGGMPAFQIWAKYPGNLVTYLIDFLNTLLPNPINIVICYLSGAYFLLRVLRLPPWPAAAGAIAFAFSSYNFIYIEAGHNNQAFAIALFAPVLASVLLTFRGKYLPGLLLSAFFIAFEIRCNHIQMTYYLCISILILVVFEGYHAFNVHQMRPFWKALLFLFFGVLLAVGINTGTLWTTYEYGQESIRGKANISRDATSGTGLGKAYAYHWSQGVGEISTFLVPNLYGGASNSRMLDEQSRIANVLREGGLPENQITGSMTEMQQNGLLNTYWGDKSSTHGPWYFGSIVIYLFVLGLLIVDHRYKWWIISTTFLFIFLSFGRNFPLVSDFFFDHVPLYNKFRAVESTLVIPALLVPLLSFMAVKELISNRHQKKYLLRNLNIALLICGGLLMVFLVIPNTFFPFKNNMHPVLINAFAKMFNGNIEAAEAMGRALVQDRIAIARMDAFRSLLFICLGFLSVRLYLLNKLKCTVSFMVLGALILADLWTVDRRYLNSDNFYDPAVIQEVFRPSPADQFILTDKSLDYRVLDLSKPDPFFNASASYFHKSIGGRHSARLQRFDELLRVQFRSSLNEHILDMLNTKYLIKTDPGTGIPQASKRPDALGNAWVVQHIKYVGNSEEEMKAITEFDPKTTAVVNEMFRKEIGEVHSDSTAKIELLNYRPDLLRYQYSSQKDIIAVFSEIWYDKGWKAYVDGKNIPYFRANYLLRAARLPAGKHLLKFRFEPASYYAGDAISMGFSLLWLGLAGFMTFKAVRNKRLTSAREAGL